LKTSELAEGIAPSRITYGAMMALGQTSVKIVIRSRGRNRTRSASINSGVPTIGRPWKERGQLPRAASHEETAAPIRVAVMLVRSECIARGCQGSWHRNGCRGWRSANRTLIDGVRNRCPTVGRSASESGRSRTVTSWVRANRSTSELRTRDRGSPRNRTVPNWVKASRSALELTILVFLRRLARRALAFESTFHRLSPVGPG
jgi:hypothetical protein